MKGTNIQKEGIKKFYFHYREYSKCITQIYCVKKISLGEVFRLVLKFSDSRIFERYCVSKFINSEMF